MNKEILVDMNELIDSVISQIQQGTKVTITGHGNSMEPFIENGQDKIVLDKIPENKKICIGEIYLYQRSNGKYAIHRIYEVDDKSVSAVGDSQFFVERNIPKENLIAIVTRVIKKDGTSIDCTDSETIQKNAAQMKQRIYRYKKQSAIKKIIRLPKIITKKILFIFRKKDPYEKKN